ncbi:MAG: aspartate aminotransferase family protein, partial [Bacteroidia bacterium]
QVEYASLICKYLPKSLNSVYFTTGGSESIEGAMKLAKRATGRSKIVAFRNAYHGSTQGSLSLMSDESFKQAFRPLIPGVIHLDYNTSDLSLIDKGVAAVFVEPIQGEAGVVEPTNDFLKKLRNRCNEVGALLVFDEIQTGFGRTGKLFAFEHYEIVPDILCAAKGMGGGLPIGAFIADIKLMQSLSNNPILGHINTFGGNAVCVEAARAALDVIINDNLINRAVEIESYFKANLKHSKIKQLRIKGALGAIEFENTEQAFKVCKKLIEAGIVTDWFLFNSNSLRISPPLVITDEELKSAVIDIIKVLDGNP